MPGPKIRGCTKYSQYPITAGLDIGKAREVFPKLLTANYQLDLFVVSIELDPIPEEGSSLKAKEASYPKTMSSIHLYQVFNR